LPTQVAGDQIEEIAGPPNPTIQSEFFAHTAPRIDANAASRYASALLSTMREFASSSGCCRGNRSATFLSTSNDFSWILESRPQVVSFHFGLPPPEVLRRIKQVGCVVLSSATTVGEARALEAQGADAIIAQGFEAGGHRGTFTSGDGAGLIGTMALVPQVVDAVGVPVIAAGGIADGRGIAAAFALGANGVQIGTAFLGWPEAAVSNPSREALHRAEDEDTRLTRVFTGRLARALRNRLIDEMGDAETLEFPVQLSLTQLLVKANGGASRADFLPLWAGQAALDPRPARCKAHRNVHRG
jgi:nitronate monooxygenase